MIFACTWLGLGLQCDLYATLVRSFGLSTFASLSGLAELPRKLESRDEMVKPRVNDISLRNCVRSGACNV